jgi:hypothetical protein
VIADNGVVAQLIGFSQPRTQLPRYLQTMKDAGFEEVRAGRNGHRLRRSVPNRKLFAKLQANANASTELLLLHRPA